MLLLVLAFISFPPHQCFFQILSKGSRFFFSFIQFLKSVTYMKRQFFQGKGFFPYLSIPHLNSRPGLLLLLYAPMTYVALLITLTLINCCHGHYPLVNCIAPVSVWHKSSFKNIVAFGYSVVCAFLGKIKNELAFL